MDVKDADYFNQLLQIHRAYKISGFSYEQTRQWERTFQNPTSLIFGKFIDLQEISNVGFPKHYFNFAAYNELPTRANVKNEILTGLQLSGTSTTYWYLSPIILKTHQIRHMYDQLTDTKPILNINNQRYEDLKQEKNRNRFPLAILLEVDPQKYQVQDNINGNGNGWEIFGSDFLSEFGVKW
ncbi:hypothetical protein Tco_1485198 [Tanacetum coccineum]